MATPPADWRLEKKLKKRDFRFFRKKSNLILLSLALFVAVTLVVYLLLLPLVPLDFEIGILKLVIAMNLASFLIVGADKTVSTYENVIRIPETFFFIVSFIGAAYGILIGMYMFNHKLRKMKFFSIAFTGVMLTSVALLIFILKS